MPLLRKDFKTEAWERLRAHVSDRILYLQTQLEGLQNTEVTTASTRGRIGELRALLALERAPVDVPRPGDRLAMGSEQVSRPAPPDDD